MEAGEDEGRKENRRRGAGGAWTTDVSRQSTRGSEVGEVGEVGVEMGQQRRRSARLLFLAASGQSAYNRYNLQCRGSRLHNVALPTATDASSSFT